MDFQLSAEASVIHAWIGFEGLLIHLFKKSSLFSVASFIGQPLKLNELTANLSRLSSALFV